MPDFIGIDEVRGFTNSSLVTPLNELILTNILAENISPESVRYALEQIGYLQSGLGRMLCKAYNITNDLLYQCQNWQEIWSRTDVIESIWNEPAIAHVLSTSEIPTKYLFSSPIATQWILDKTTNETFLPIQRIRDLRTAQKVQNDRMILLDDVSLSTYTVPEKVTTMIVMCVSAGGAGSPGREDKNQTSRGGNGGGNGGIGGASDTYWMVSGAGGGGGGYQIHRLDVTPGQIIPLHIAPNTTLSPENGGTTTFGEITGVNYKKIQKYILPNIGRGGIWTNSQWNGGGSSGEDGGGNGGKGGAGGTGTDTSPGGRGAGGFAFGEFNGNAGSPYGSGGTGGSNRWSAAGSKGSRGCIALILGGENL